MNDDSLKRMAAALADENDGAHAAPQVTRARVQRLLAEKQKKRRSWLVFGVPLFAVFAGSTAWAALHDGAPALDSLLSVFETPDSKSVASLEARVVASAATQSATSAPSETAPSASSSAMGTPASAAIPSTPSTVSSPAVSSPAVSSSTVSSPTVVAASTAGKRPVSVASATAPTPVIAPAIDPSTLGLDVYKRAHARQFHESNCASALTDYADYVRIAPQGAFVLEARYNSGVCLARLGRVTEARRSLQPFANGSLGEYRSAEARALLEALDAPARAE